MQEIVGLVLMSTSAVMIGNLITVLTMPSSFGTNSERDVGLLITAAATCLWGVAAYMG